VSELARGAAQLSVRTLFRSAKGLSKVAPKKARREPADLALSITLDEEGVFRMSMGYESIEAKISDVQNGDCQFVDDDDNYDEGDDDRT
jgi:hypothetical protein